MVSAHANSFVALEDTISHSADCEEPPRTPINSVNCIWAYVGLPCAMNEQTILCHRVHCRNYLRERESTMHQKALGKNAMWLKLNCVGGVVGTKNNSQICRVQYVNVFPGAQRQ